MYIYIDESGDLGFILNKPFRNGGSSRYLTITFLLVPENLSHHPRRIVRELYEKRKRSPKNEIKGNSLSKSARLFVAENAVKLLLKFPKIKIMAITVNKQNVEEHICKDANKLYNYMIGLVLPGKVKHQEKITLIPDKRSIKVKSGNSLEDYLKIKLWFDLKSAVHVECKPSESHVTLNLQFIDWISNIVWRSYEDGENEALDLIREQIELHELFF